MKKLLEFIKNEHIQLACVSGACIIILAVFFKKFMHEPVPSMAAAVPALIFAFAEGVIVKVKKGLWSRVWTWNSLALLATAIIIVKRLI
jgi:hypothetical protein